MSLQKAGGVPAGAADFNDVPRYVTGIRDASDQESELLRAEKVLIAVMQIASVRAIPSQRAKNIEGNFPETGTYRHNTCFLPSIARIPRMRQTSGSHTFRIVAHREKKQTTKNASLSLLNSESLGYLRQTNIVQDQNVRTIFLASVEDLSVLTKKRRNCVG